MGPGIVQLGDGTLDHRAPLIFDAENIATGDLSNLVRRYSALSRSLENGGKQSWCNGYDPARAAFAEQRIFGWRGFRWQIDLSAELRHSLLRPCREAGFGQRNSNAAVAHVVRRPNRPIGRKRDQAFLQALLGRQTDGWRIAGDNASDRLRIFAGGKLALRGRYWRGMLRGYNRTGSVKQNNYVTLFAKSVLQHARSVFQNA